MAKEYNLGFNGKRIQNLAGLVSGGLWGVGNDFRSRASGHMVTPPATQKDRMKNNNNT